MKKDLYCGICGIVHGCEQGTHVRHCNDGSCELQHCEPPSTTVLRDCPECNRAKTKSQLTELDHTLQKWSPSLNASQFLKR